MNVDDRISAYFNGRIKQVFVYVTSRCQLRCRQCLYKPLLTTDHDDLPFGILSELLELFKRYGAFKLSFLGGEPTLYHDMHTHKEFPDLVAEGKRLGYTLVRADTNGQFNEEFLLNEDVKKLDELTFSLDGATPEIHDAIRGKIGVFETCIRRIRLAVRLGYRVQITTCIHIDVCGTIDDGIRQIENMIRLCDLLGVHSLNFHPILKVGVDRDNWIDHTEINPSIWLEVYRKMVERLETLDHHVAVRLPMRYVEESNFTKDHTYCPLRMGERVLIMPDGQLKICAFNIGNPYCLARFGRDGSIVYEELHNECDKLKGCDIGCCNQRSPKGLQPLCMSYKPNQEEAVWCTLRER